MSDDFSDIPVDQGHHHLVHYKLLETNGKGSFDKVMSGRHLLTGTKVAIKVIAQEAVEKLHKPFLPEVSCMAALSHPNIIRLFDVINTTEQLFLVMELKPEGDIDNFLQDNGSMWEDDEARHVFRQLISAVHHCHEKGIVHRDIKAQNVLLDGHMNVKLTDFGVGTFFNGCPLSTYCGTPAYFAPELCMRENYGPGVDVWALGVLLYLMLTDTLPFRGMPWRGVQQEILGGQYSIPCYLSSEAQDLIKNLLTPNPEDRQNIQVFMRDPWLNLGQEELKPYVEPPRGVTDPWVARKMLKFGFSLEEIETGLSNKAYTRVSATYHILKAKAAKINSYTTPVEPSHPPELQSRSPSPAHTSSKAAAILESSIFKSPAKAWPTFPPPSRVSKTDAPESSPEAATAAPEAAPEVTTIFSPGSPPTPTPRPLPVPGRPGDSPSSHSLSSCSGNGEETSQGRREVARRCLHFVRRFCCLPPRNGPWRRNKVTPL